MCPVDQHQKRLSPLARRVLYVVTFEAFAIVLASLLLSLLSGEGAHDSILVAAATSVIAVVWNFIYNSVFEAWERARGLENRTFALRVLHTLGFEGGLVALLIPLYMWWFQVGILAALQMEVALLVFFLVFTFTFTWLFDRCVPK